MYPLMIIASALLALSGCDGTTGIISDSGIGTETPAPETPAPETPVPDAVTSTVTASPVTIAADGAETSTVTVTVNDANSNPVTNAIVTLAQTGTSTISTVTNVEDGTYTFSVTSTTPETVTYTATADGVTITQTADITFTITEAQCLSDVDGYEYLTIVINGQTWLDRNLGASQAASAVNDTLAFGYLHQWGRSADGHQERNSENNDTLATTLDGSDVNTDWYGKFIISTGGDWLDNTGNIDNNDSLRAQSWSTPYDANQVCPCGYIVPTVQDFMALTLTDPTARDTFKLAAAEGRSSADGSITTNNTGYFWTTDVAQSKPTLYYVTPGSNTESTAQFNEGWGFSVRCIKPTP